MLIIGEVCLVSPFIVYLHQYRLMGICFVLPVAIQWLFYFLAHVFQLWPLGELSVAPVSLRDPVCACARVSVALSVLCLAPGSSLLPSESQPFLQGPWVPLLETRIRPGSPLFLST